MGEIDKEKLKDPIYFLENLLNLTLASFHKEWIEMVQKNKRVCIQAPRGHGKTEVLIIGYMIYKAFIKTNFEGLIISKSLPQSTDVLRRIKMHLRGSEMLASSIPGGQENVWSKTEIELTNGSRIMCKPYSDAVRGFHVDLVCCDEVDTYPEKETFRYAITPTVNKKHGSIVVIGTPKSKIGLLYDLTANKGYKSKIYRAYIKKNKPLWPESFPVEILKQIEVELGKLGFSQEYMCDPLSEESRVFPYEIISKTFIDFPFLSEAREGYVYYIGADFAMSGAAGADYSVFTVVEKDEYGKVTLVELERYKGISYEGQMNYLMNLIKKFNPLKVIVDEKSFGQTFLQDLRSRGVSVVGYRFTNESKVDLITHCVNQFEKGNVRICYADKFPTKERVDILIDELINFGITYTRTGMMTFEGIGKHDDTVISFCLAIYISTRYAYAPLLSARRSDYGKGK